MLRNKLEEYTDQATSKLPEETIEIIKKANQELIESNFARNGLKVGDKAPEFTLPNFKGQTISSKELLKKGPLIISFYRGSWCPYCNLEMQEWENIYPKVKRIGAELVAISPNVAKKAEEMSKTHNVSFEILTDANNHLANKFGLVFKLSKELISLHSNFGIDLKADNNADSFTLPIPATYVINGQRIVYAFVEIDYKKRAEPSKILDFLKNQIQD